MSTTKLILLIVLYSLIAYPFFICAQVDLLPLHGPSENIIKHKNYTLHYNESYEQPDWVFYKLTRNYFKYAPIERTNNFREDPMVTTGSATLEDYKGSGYDRGHLAPAGDMIFSHTAMSESFYMSNMSPQNPSFNRGIWKRLESLVRTWAVEYDTIYVVTAGDLTEVYSLIGPNNVGVPSYYYKVILDYVKPEIKGIAFYLPNEKGNRSLDEYAVSIDYIEERTGIDFFYELPDSIESIIESSFDITKWYFPSSTVRKSRSKRKYFDDTKAKININTATIDELDRLYGIGTSKAQAIIEARPYKSVDEITKAYGIGPKTLERVRPYITVGDPSNYEKVESQHTTAAKININAASQSELESLPGIGKILAKRIVNSRPFRNTEELLNIKGIGQGRFNKIKDRITVR